MTDSTNISEPLRTICDQLGVPYADVAEILITATAAEVTLNRRDENGSFYLVDGEPAQRVERLAVRT